MNPVRKHTPLTIGGVTYKLVADFEMISQAEDITGRALITGLTQKDITSPTINLVRAMFFACARSHHPALTYDEAKTLVTRKTLADVWGKVLTAWVDAAAEEDEVESNPIQDQS
jgi:hypothetical protein